MRKLWETTRDLHHACEQHPVGQRMMKGEVTDQEWADWLYAFDIIHSTVDMHLPSNMWRWAKLNKDFAALKERGVTPNKSKAAVEYADSLLRRPLNDVLGAAYVLHGAHRRGGQVLKKIVDKPCHHVEYDNSQEAEAFVKMLSEKEELTDAARECFGVLLKVMDEISGKS